MRRMPRLGMPPSMPRFVGISGALGVDLDQDSLGWRMDVSIRMAVAACWPLALPILLAVGTQLAGTSRCSCVVHHALSPLAEPSRKAVKNIRVLTVHKILARHVDNVLYNRALLRDKPLTPRRFFCREVYLDVSIRKATDPAHRDLRR